ncbi:MAG: T9SS type A sorting domain-containing protein [Ignavibacteria bacterium]|nr:T9SS type A sorting domain-containing protein [Ignavibacteria bacterium]
MKKILTISFILAITILVFAFRNSPSENSIYSTAQNFNNQNIVALFPPLQGNISDEYLIGAMDCAQDLTYNNISDLGLNVWHKYAGVDRYYDYNSTGWDWYLQPANRVDNLYNEYITYSRVVTDRLGLNGQNNMRTLMQRPKIDQLAFGQRSDYQCEIIPENDNLWFYSFNHHGAGIDTEDYSQWGEEGQIVRYCSQNQTDGGEGWVVKRLKANSEQCNTRSPIGQTPGDNVYNWYIKPRVRIDSNFAHNNQNDKVCRIDIYNYENGLILSADLLGKNFLVDGNPGAYYNGRYIEVFNFAPLDNQLIIQAVPPYATNAFNPNDSSWAFNSRGNYPTDGSNKMDIQVYWYGTCDMWIDYVRVDNDVAHRLLKGNDQEFESWLQWEASLGNTNSSPLKFYIEEFEFNHIPCMSYVSKKLKHYSGNENLSLMSMVNLQQYILHLPYEYVNNNRVSAEHISRYLIDSVGETQVLSEPYALTGVIAGTNYNDSKVPSTLPSSNYSTTDGRLGEPVTPAVYESWLQEHLDAAGTNIHTKKGQFTWYIKTMDTLSKMNNISYINMPQTHLWYTAGEEALREPTNEEMEMTTLLPVTYGAKGTLYFWYGGFGCLGNGNYARGLVDPVPCTIPNPQTTSLVPRDTNAYGQLKWEKIKSINQKLTAWGPTLMSFDNANRHSYIYRLENERNSLNNSTYFWQVMSFNHNTGTPSCNYLSGPTEPPAENMRIDCPDSTYLQVATFKKSDDDGNKYFMIVNRRCAPLQANHNDGERFVRVAFDRDSPEFSGFNIWEISDVTPHGSSIGAFDKNGYDSFVDLGWFKPGEGRLYKISPVMKSGGMLVADEVTSNQSFTCKDTIFNDGHNITIGGNTSILFNDTSKIVVNGGSITIGDLETSNTITLGSITGNAWHGLELNNCEVRIYNTTFTGLANDTTYAINAIDCPVLDVRNCTFNINSNIKGGIKAVYYNEPEIDNIYIGGNIFNFAGSTLEAVNVSGYAGMTTPLLIENNTISEGNIAILLSGITGGAVKSNALYNNNIGLSLLTSSVDISGNTIYSEIDNAIGIFTAGGIARLNRSAALKLGGLNDISNTGTGTNNIKAENGYFIMDVGENLFNISDDQTSYHLSGYFPMGDIELDATINCFKLGGSQSDPPVNYITWGEQGSQVEFTFSPYLSSCNLNEQMNFMVLDLGDNIYDTIGTTGGEGGSHSSKVVVQTPKQMNDSLSIYIRKHDYSNAELKCFEMLNTYPDSILSLGAISKLFLSITASDTSQAGMQELKNYYEGLILANGNNSELVKRANYYIQKCKVHLHDYTSALSGFQQIINQNPYNFEGLQARWDYMATSLLMQGQGGGVSSIGNYELGITNVKSGISDVGFGIANFGNDVGQRHVEPNSEALSEIPQSGAFDYYDIEGNDDRSPYTKEQRQNIRKSINNAFEITKSIDEQTIKKLEDNSRSGDITSQKQLNQKRALQQVIRTEKPKNIVEHMKIVQQDIQKVLGGEVKSKSGKESSIPLVFSLSQNYPNPFNPVTTIKYALPNDVKVIVKIYDILGREVKTLVNDFQKAGYYDAKFEGSNYASGVYFYRIEAGEFVQSKKMVLVK